LIDDYATNSWLIGRLTDGITHEESLLQLPFEANCFNWLVGHMVSGRNTAMKVLGLTPIWPEETVVRYRTGSTPITGPGCGEARLEDLLGDLEEAGRRIAAALADMNDAELARPAETDRGVKQTGEHLEGLHWHETYHIGQLELLRALALSMRRQ
jgi:hypothetical protein